MTEGHLILTVSHFFRGLPILTGPIDRGRCKERQLLPQAFVVSLQLTPNFVKAFFKT